MSTLTEARAAIVAALESGDIPEANVYGFALPEGSTFARPRISLVTQNIRYYQTTGVCKRAEVSGVIVVEVPGGTSEDLSTNLDEYLDPYDDKSVIAVLMAAAAPGGSLMDAMDAFITTEANYVSNDTGEIPFQFHVSSPS